jgi:RNA polymerase sigma-70 factor, ECF subfamily
MVRPRAVRRDSAGEAAARVARARPFDEVPDEALVERARAGDRWAEEALFRKHVDYIGALSFRLLRNHADADDVVQDTFVDALAQLRTLTTPAALRSWLTRIAVHKAHRRFRRQKLRAFFGLAQSTHEAVLEACAPADVSGEMRTELGLLDATLRTVPDVARAAWILRHVEGFSLEEVGKLCGCSLATAKRRIQRAQASVLAHVDIECPGDDTIGADDE